jgi:hypothetical protein
MWFLSNVGISNLGLVLLKILRSSLWLRRWDARGGARLRRLGKKMFEP